MRRLALLVVLGTSAGCFSSELDPTLGGAFACGREVGDPECPDGQACSNDRCQPVDIIPRVEVSSPFQGEALEVDETGPMLARTISFATMQGSFTLKEPGGEHVFGEGHIKVSVDGVEQATITSGNPSGGLDVPVEIGNTVGAHRLSVELFRNDGDPYIHDGSRGRVLFWIPDDRPRVAVVKPWPGDAFPLDELAIEVEIATQNFEVVPSGTAPVFRKGHAHVHYDDPFPACPDDPTCDPGYFVLVDKPVDVPMVPPGSFGVPADGVVALLPEEDKARMVEVTAILRHVNHPPYRLPDQTDGGEFQVLTEGGEVITDTVLIRRE